MSTPPRHMNIGMNILVLGGHQSAWRMGEAPWSVLQEVKYFQNIARISEHGTLDAIFLADGPALAGSVVRQPAGRLEPTVPLTAVALATERIGVISTLSTCYTGTTHREHLGLPRPAGQYTRSRQLETA